MGFTATAGGGSTVTLAGNRMATPTAHTAAAVVEPVILTRCRVCNVDIMGREGDANYQQHINGKLHRKTVAKMGLQESCGNEPSATTTTTTSSSAAEVQPVEPPYPPMTFVDLEPSAIPIPMNSSSSSTDPRVDPSYRHRVFTLSVRGRDELLSQLIFQGQPAADMEARKRSLDRTYSRVAASIQSASPDIFVLQHVADSALRELHRTLVKSGITGNTDAAPFAVIPSPRMPEWQPSVRHVLGIGRGKYRPVGQRVLMLHDMVANRAPFEPMYRASMRGVAWNVDHAFAWITLLEDLRCSKSKRIMLLVSVELPQSVDLDVFRTCCVRELYREIHSILSSGPQELKNAAVVIAGQFSATPSSACYRQLTSWSFPVDVALHAVPVVNTLDVVICDDEQQASSSSPMHSSHSIHSVAFRLGLEVPEAESCVGVLHTVRMVRVSRERILQSILFQWNISVAHRQQVTDADVGILAAWLKELHLSCVLWTSGLRQIALRTLDALLPNVSLAMLQRWIAGEVSVEALVAHAGVADVWTVGAPLNEGYGVEWDSDQRKLTLEWREPCIIVDRVVDLDVLRRSVLCSCFLDPNSPALVVCGMAGASLSALHATKLRQAVSPFRGYARWDDLVTGCFRSAYSHYALMVPQGREHFETEDERCILSHIREQIIRTVGPDTAVLVPPEGNAVVSLLRNSMGRLIQQGGEGRSPVFVGKTERFETWLSSSRDSPICTTSTEPRFTCFAVPGVCHQVSTAADLVSWCGNAGSCTTFFDRRGKKHERPNHFLEFGCVDYILFERHVMELVRLAVLPSLADVASLRGFPTTDGAGTPSTHVPICAELLWLPS